MFGMRPSQKKWPDRGDVSVDDGITNARLDLSERAHGAPLSQPLEPDPPWWPLRSELQGGGKSLSHSTIVGCEPKRWMACAYRSNTGCATAWPVWSARTV